MAGPVCRLREMPLGHRFVISREHVSARAFKPWAFVRVNVNGKDEDEDGECFIIPVAKFAPSYLLTAPGCIPVKPLRPDLLPTAQRINH